MAAHLPARNQDADVLVVGAGLTGAVIAERLASRGLRVAVVDAMPVAGGATRRAAGLVTPDLSPANIQSTARGADLLAGLAQRLNIARQPTPVWHVSADPARSAALRDLAAGRGPVELAWETGAAALPAGYTGALRAGNSFYIDLAALTVRLLQQPNIAVRPNVEIRSLQGVPGGVVAIAQEYTLQVGAVVLAAGVYSGFVSPYLADAVRIAQGAVWRSRPIGRLLPSLAAPVVVDDGRLVIAQAPDQRLYLAAWQWDGRWRGDPAEAVRAYLNTRLPEMLNETEAWLSAMTTATPDGVPLVGALAAGDENLAGRVFYALGGGAYSAAWVPIVAERIAELILRT